MARSNSVPTWAARATGRAALAYVASSARHRLLLTLSLVPLLLAIGTLGYVLLEGWSVGDAFYMTVITLSTVGYGEVRHLGSGGRLFTSGLILGGVGTLLYSVTSLVASLIEGDLSGGILEQQQRRRLAGTRDHVVVCGYGRVGQSLCLELQREGLPMVVVDADSERVALARRERLVALNGDATQDEVLVLAGIDRARGLAVVLDDDTKNVFITLSGRALNADLLIVARAAQPSSEQKLLQAGANRVVSPYTMGGERMAQVITRPNVLRFLESTLSHRDDGFVVEEYPILPQSTFAGRTVAALLRAAGQDVAVLAVIGPDGVSANPNPERVVRPGETLIVIGLVEQLARLRAVLGNGGPAQTDDLSR